MRESIYVLSPPMQVSVMMQNGNAQVNDHLEHSLPPGVLKPLPVAQLATKELYIRAKYDHQAFAKVYENHVRYVSPLLLFLVHHSVYFPLSSISLSIYIYTYCV